MEDNKTNHVDLIKKYYKNISDKELELLVEHYKDYSDEELENKLKQMIFPEENKKSKNIIRKIFGIIGGFITFLIVLFVLYFLVGVFIAGSGFNSGMGYAGMFIFLMLLMTSLVIGVKVYSLISGEKVDIDKWLTDNFT